MGRHRETVSIVANAFDEGEFGYIASRHSMTV